MSSSGTFSFCDISAIFSEFVCITDWSKQNITKAEYIERQVCFFGTKTSFFLRVVKNGEGLFVPVVRLGTGETILEGKPCEKVRNAKKTVEFMFRAYLRWLAKVV